MTNRTKKTINKRKLRRATQILLVGFLTSSTTLPQFSSYIYAETEKNLSSKELKNLPEAGNTESKTLEKDNSINETNSNVSNKTSCQDLQLLIEGEDNNNTVEVEDTHPLNEIIPNNIRAVSDIATQLGISTDSQVNQNQLNQITQLTASASGWEGFQNLTNLQELILDSGEGNPLQDIQFVLPLTALTTLTFSGRSVRPDITTDLPLDMRNFSALSSIQNVNFRNIDVSFSSSDYQYKNAITNPIIGVHGETTIFSPFLLGIPGSTNSFDIATNTFQKEVGDGISVAGSLAHGHVFETSVVSGGITYSSGNMSLDGTAYGDFILSGDQEVIYGLNQNVSEQQFLRDIEAKYQSNYIKGVTLSSNFSNAVDWATPGTYTVVVNTELTDNLDQRAKAKPLEVQVHVIAVNSKDSTIYVDDEWQPEDNFVSGIGKNGEELFFKDVDITGEVDTSKAGIYEVKYSYEGVESIAMITVKDKQAAVSVHDSTLYVGDEWKAEDNFDSAIDKAGNPVDFNQLTIDDSKVNTNIPGTYDVTYTYDGITSTAKVTVKAKQTAVNVHDSTIYVGDNWKAEDNFDSAIDKAGNPVDFKDVSITGEVDTSKVGAYEVTYSYEGVEDTAIITAINPPETNSSVIVKYVDTDGNKISEDIVKSGAVGEGYNTGKKSIEGYTFKEVQGNTTGQFTNLVQTVTYVYSKNKANTVNTEPKPENKLDSKDKNNNKGTTSSTQHGLPATGENGRMTMMSIILGLILLAMGAVVSIFRFKKVNK
ncbi:bacterial Ig-like domain-containing protein [Lactococcus garvieae]|uniref:bacterial Ig-like domain-containing protein n=1 Tax=Lactococcus garvieae TaxID=1363 RepID=UPI0023EB132B|nr:bacterial Ig-like domain-containing protein [Lactococcus garvieae]